MLDREEPVPDKYEPIIAEWMDIPALNAWYDIGWAIILTDGRVVKISNPTSSGSNGAPKVNWNTVRVFENTPTYVKIGLPEVKFPEVPVPFYTTIQVDKKGSGPILPPPWKRPMPEKASTPVQMELGAFGSDERGILFLMGLRHPVKHQMG